MSSQTQGPSRFIDSDAGEAERQWGMFTHLAGVVSVVTFDHSLFSLIATIILWRIKAEKSPFLEDHGREATNFQITLLIYALASLCLSLLTMGVLAAPLYVIIIALRLYGCIRGAIAAHRGELYRYPMCLRFLK